MDRIIVTSAEPIDGALPLGEGAYEVMESRYLVVDKDDKPLLDEKGQPVIATGYALPKEAVELKALDRVAAVKPRTDLPASHPWYGYRFASACFSGDTDRVMGVDGEWHPVTSQRDLDDLVAAGKVRRGVEPPKPINEKPIEEVTRVR